MRRRDFITAIGSSLAAWPSALSAQPAERIRVVGALMSQGNDSRSQANLAQLRDSLRDLGWTDGRNLRLEVRWGAGEMDRTRIFALELAKLSPDVILATGTSAIQMKTACEEIVELGGPRGFRPLSHAGDSGMWTCIDLVDVVLHVFDHESRAFYDLDNLWGDGRVVEWRETA